ncbi:MAG: ABC transporter substrate-binding protein [Acidobacteriota bacterium]
MRTITAVALLGLAACTSDKPPSRPWDRHGGTLRIDAPRLNQFRSFDPVRITDINSSSIASTVYEGLIGYAPGAADRFTPALAASWESSADLQTWTFRLRQEVRFHDDPCFPGGRGRRVVAEDVRDSLLRFLRGAPEAPLSLRHEVVGAEQFVRGEADDVRGIEVPDSLTIRFRLNRRSNIFLHALATSAGWVIPREAVALYGAGLARHPVGTGPFRLASWNSATLVFVRNEHYWRTNPDGDRLPYLETLVMKRASAGADRWTTLSDLLEGNLHVLYFTGELEWHESEELTKFLARRGVRIVRTPKLNTIFYGFNMARDTPWARQAELRRAVSYAVRRPVPGGLLIPAGGLVPPGLCGAQGRNPIAQDLETARQLLASAGYPGGTGLPPLHLGHLGRTEFLQTSVLGPLEELGIKIRLQMMPWEVHWQALDRGAYEFFRDGWIADYADAENFLSLFQSGAPSNHTHYANPEYDALLEQYRALPPGAPKKIHACQQLEKILRRDCPAIFLYHEQSVYLVSNRVHGIDASINPFERKFYEQVWLARQEPQT